MGRGGPGIPVSPAPLARLSRAVKDDAPSAAALQLPPAERDPADDGALVRRLRAGDRAALAELVGLHHAAIARLVHRLAGYSADTDDLVQDVFVRATASARAFDGRSSVETWLTRIAINVCRTHHRRRFLRASFWARLRARRAGEPVGHPHRRLDEAERDDRVRATVAALPPKYRQVVVLHYLEQRSVDDVARLLDVSKNAVEVRLHRARKLLDDRLRDLMTE